MRYIDSTKHRAILIGIAIILLGAFTYYYQSEAKKIKPGTEAAAFALAVEFVLVTYRGAKVQTYALPVIEGDMTRVTLETDMATCAIELIKADSQKEFGWLLKKADCKERNGGFVEVVSLQPLTLDEDAVIQLENIENHCRYVARPAKSGTKLKVTLLEYDNWNLKLLSKSCLTETGLETTELSQTIPYPSSPGLPALVLPEGTKFKFFLKGD